MDKLLKLDKTGDSKLLKKIKKSLSLRSDDELFMHSGKDYLVIKKIQRTSLTERFKNLSRKVELRFEKEGLGEDMVSKAIKISRDPHILKIKEFEGIKIKSPEVFRKDS